LLLHLISVNYGQTTTRSRLFYISPADRTTFEGFPWESNPRSNERPKDLLRPGDCGPGRKFHSPDLDPPHPHPPSFQLWRTCK
ncbi:unnamed protein product, partial [Nesidiocoris tenuis]